MKYKNEDLYKGEIKDGKRNGKGIMIYKSVDIYDGNWVDNEKEGKGIMTFKNGKIFDGYWENDNHLKGIIKYNNMKKFKVYETENYYDDDEKKGDNNKLETNDNELNEFIKSFDLNTQYCQMKNHKNLIIGICIDKNCKNKNKLLCQNGFLKSINSLILLKLENIIRI